MTSVQANDTYYLTNVKGGSCIDLSGGDNVTITGYGYHQGLNQAWTFQDAGNGTFYLKSAGGNQFLSVEGDPGDGRKLVGGPSPYAWRVQNEPNVDSGIRLCPSVNPNYCVDLSDHGNPTPGTPIQLWGRWEGQNQVWKLQKVQ